MSLALLVESVLGPRRIDRDMKRLPPRDAACGTKCGCLGKGHVSYKVRLWLYGDPSQAIEYGRCSGSNTTTPRVQSGVFSPPRCK